MTQKHTPLAKGSTCFAAARPLAFRDLARWLCNEPPQPDGRLRSAAKTANSRHSTHDSPCGELHLFFSIFPPALRLRAADPYSARTWFAPLLIRPRRATTPTSVVYLGPKSSSVGCSGRLVLSATDRQTARYFLTLTCLQTCTYTYRHTHVACLFLYLRQSVTSTLHRLFSTAHWGVLYSLACESYSWVPRTRCQKRNTSCRAERPACRHTPHLLGWQMTSLISID